MALAAGFTLTSLLLLGRQTAAPAELSAAPAAPGDPGPAPGDPVERPPVRGDFLAPATVFAYPEGQRSLAF